MDEKNANTIIEVLAETVRSLRVDVLILKSENERLHEKIAKNAALEGESTHG